MKNTQPGILAPISAFSRYLEFSCIPEMDVTDVLRELASMKVDEDFVIGFGPGLVQKFGGSIGQLRPFPALSGPGCEIPSTQSDIWCCIRGADRGAVFRKARDVANRIGAGFRQTRLVDGFKYDAGLDLTGYEDGTENPEGDLAVKAAILAGSGDALDGSSFVAIQQWVHDLDGFERRPQKDRDNIIGRRRSDNFELEDAPEFAHVKRTAQESFDPEAFVVRRSMPWADTNGEGLLFVAYGNSFDAFEAQLRRMVGLEDGILDGLFRFTRPISGGYYWCPPVSDGHLNLAAIGL